MAEKPQADQRHDYQVTFRDMVTGEESIACGDQVIVVIASPKDPITGKITVNTIINCQDEHGGEITVANLIIHIVRYCEEFRGMFVLRQALINQLSKSLKRLQPQDFIKAG